MAANANSPQVICPTSDYITIFPFFILLIVTFNAIVGISI